MGLKSRKRFARERRQQVGDARAVACESGRQLAQSICGDTRIHLMSITLFEFILSSVFLLQVKKSDSIHVTLDRFFAPVKNGGSQGNFVLTHYFFGLIFNAAGSIVN